MASPLINYDAFTTLPANPTAEQLSEWLTGGRSALRDAAEPVRLWDAIQSGRSTEPQRRKLLGRLIDGAKASLGSLARWLADNLGKGIATLDGWYKKFAGIAATHQYAGVMTTLGTVDPSPADRKSADSEVRKQLGFLTRFREQLRTGAQPLFLLKPDENGQFLVNGKFVHRSELYGDALWGVAQQVQREKMTREGYTRELWVLHRESHHCPDCPYRAGLGWVPIGSSPQIGTVTCKTSCRCHMTYGHDDSALPVSPIVDRPIPSDKPPVAATPARTSRPVPSGPRPLPPASRPAKSPDDPSLAFTASERSRRDKDKMVWVDVAKLDRAWSRDTSYYISPGGSGQSMIKGRYSSFERFLETAKADERPIEMSQVHVDDSGNVDFIDGRHRFAVLRDQGITSLPIAVDPDAAERMARLYGVD